MAWSRFYGTVRGKGVKEVTQQGTESSGLRVIAATKDNGSLKIELIGMSDGRDKFSIEMCDHGSSSVWKGVLAEGFMGTDAREAILPTPTIESFDDEALAAEVKRRFNFDLLLRKGEPPLPGFKLCTQHGIGYQYAASNLKCPLCEAEEKS